MISDRVRSFPVAIGRTVLPLVSALICLAPAIAQDQPPESMGNEADEETLEIIELGDPTAPNPSEELRPLSLDGSLLSLPGARRLMEEARTAVSAQDYDTAAQKLQDARQVLNQLSNYYQELAATFSGIDNRIFESQRALALESAQLRDRATYELALLHRAQNKPELAIPLLIQIVRSQNPTRELGQAAYQQLFELGFVDSPYPRNRDSQSSSSNP
ncbi:MAG TPA: hypothetical protein IGS17_18825 [Oscillatoriales cyanobacterium M59_W2019_021]|nr:hypothetical protein [Oscillatoriales cyanobacterium M4454_W2019_049]HIK52951.1 hypothetical protein [Oscillatoriales cyanobacterium M59_W2019_021]